MCILPAPPLEKVSSRVSTGWARMSRASKQQKQQRRRGKLEPAGTIQERLFWVENEHNEKWERERERERRKGASFYYGQYTTLRTLKDGIGWPPLLLSPPLPPLTKNTMIRGREEEGRSRGYALNTGLVFFYSSPLSLSLTFDRDDLTLQVCSLETWQPPPTATFSPPLPLPLPLALPLPLHPYLYLYLYFYLYLYIHSCSILFFFPSIYPLVTQHRLIKALNTEPFCIPPSLFSPASFL